jgi:O-succinylbenzoate synthase
MDRWRLERRPFRFRLSRAMVTAHGALAERRGWLLRLQSPEGRIGWGEAAPLEAATLTSLPWSRAWAALEACTGREPLEALLPALPPPLAFAVGAALAEVEGLVGAAAGGWRSAPESAWLLPAGSPVPALLALALPSRAAAGVAADTAGGAGTAAAGGSAGRFTLKWKVAVHPSDQELAWLEELLALLPPQARLRLDANGGWGRREAFAWAERLASEERLEWLEQPLPPEDLPGLEQLARRVPVALDESLQADPSLAQRWPGWQVRRPALEGDPRPLLVELAAGRPWWMVSTALETGIARRWLHHLAALQADGPTPTAPGLAPGWSPSGPLFAEDPAKVWEAAG